VTEAQDLREFIREMNHRFERTVRALIAEMREDRRAIKEDNRMYFERLHAEALEQRRRTDDLIAESRAQRAALFRILDRLDGGGNAAPAG
jgi:hypothetical protein